MLTNKAVTEALGGLLAHKLHCSVLAEKAIRAVVKDYYDRKGIAYDPKDFSDCGSCEACRSQEIHMSFGSPGGFTWLPKANQNTD